MKLYEYQSKGFFKKYGIPIPAGHVTSIAREAKQIAEEIGLPVVVKAQVLAEGRGMAGGIRLAKTPEETEIFASEILSAKIHGLPVQKVLIDEALSIEKEYFILISIDRAKKRPLLMMYDSGTIYIEAAANALFENLDRVYIDPLIGLQRYQIHQLAYKLDFPGKYIRSLTEICMGLWRLFCDLDARMAAINPLVITTDQRILALDGKITLDDNARFRQESLTDFVDLGYLKYGELEAGKHGLDFIKMDGNIACMINGAGLTMTTLDLIEANGGKPANFLDLGAGVNTEKILAAMDILQNDPAVKVILVCIYAGMTHCDDVARGLLEAMNRYDSKIPIVVYMGGSMSALGNQILSGSPAILVPSYEEAIRKAVETAAGQG